MPVLTDLYRELAACSTEVDCNALGPLGAREAAY